MVHAIAYLDCVGLISLSIFTLYLYIYMRENISYGNETDIIGPRLSFAWTIMTKRLYVLPFNLLSVSIIPAQFRELVNWPTRISIYQPLFYLILFLN